MGGLAQKYAAAGGMVQWDEFVDAVMGKVRGVVVRELLGYWMSSGVV